MSHEETEPEQLLVDQLGSEVDILLDYRYDYQILSDIKEEKYGSHLYFGLVNTIIEAKEREEAISFTEAIDRNALKLNISIGGRGRRDLLYAEQVRRGIGINLKEEIPKPGRWDRVPFIGDQEKVEAYEQQQKRREELELD